MGQPLLSIIINNYNYARYVADAIDSALAQSHRPVEVIIVDDGSTDGSRAIIEGYGDQVSALFKHNGGQASALNCGFATSHGEIVIFLDADDRLHPDAAARVARTFAQRPAAGKVLYRLAVIGADGRPSGLMTPEAMKTLPHGNVLPRLLGSPDDLPWPPMSGNAFRRSVLERMMPVPEAEYPICADYYLSTLAPLYGQVAALTEPAGDYRAHGQNNHHQSRISATRRRQVIRLTAATHQHLRRAARTEGYAPPEPFASRSFLAHRLLSLREDRAAHPLPGDSVKAVFSELAAHLRQRGDPLLDRLRCAAWFLATAAAPPPVVAYFDRLYFGAP